VTLIAGREALIPDRGCLLDLLDCVQNVVATFAPTGCSDTEMISIEIRRSRRVQPPPV
jgi:hypothetical protein